MAIQRQTLSQHVSVGGEFSLPETITDNCHGRRALLILFRHESLTEHWPGAQSLEKVCRHAHTLQLFGFSSVSKLPRPLAKRRQFLKRFCFFYEAEVISR